MWQKFVAEQPFKVIAGPLLTDIVMIPLFVNANPMPCDPAAQPPVQVAGKISVTLPLTVTTTPLDQVHYFLEKVSVPPAATSARQVAALA